MELLNQPISSFSFDDVSSFCKKRYPEGIQIDYKKKIPKGKLAKHFASFSNTRGGLIIIGVEESKKGIPMNWEGIENKGKLIERVHQYAANVDPFPNYETCITNGKNGKVFLLIRILEGDKTPYYVQNDSNIWVRTGNISKPIDIASPKELERLFNKREKSKLARSIFKERAHEIYSAGLKRAEMERRERIAKEKEEYLRKQRKEGATNPSLDGFQTLVTQSELGSNVAMCTILLQPYFPRRTFVGPLELKKSLQDFRARGRLYGDFPSLYVKAETVPEGVLFFSWRRDGWIKCEQIYGHGLIFNSVDVVRIEDDIRQLWLGHIGKLLFVTLLAARNFYRHFGYQGGLNGHLLLEDVRGVLVNRITPDGWSHFSNPGKCLLNKYRLEIDTETTVLNTPKALQNLFFSLIRDIYVGFDMSPPKIKLLGDFLKKESWLVEENNDK